MQGRGCCAWPSWRLRAERLRAVAPLAAPPATSVSVEPTICFTCGRATRAAAARVSGRAARLRPRGRGTLAPRALRTFLMDVDAWPEARRRARGARRDARRLLRSASACTAADSFIAPSLYSPSQPPLTPHAPRRGCAVWPPSSACAEARLPRLAAALEREDWTKPIFVTTCETLIAFGVTLNNTGQDGSSSAGCILGRQPNPNLTPNPRWPRCASPRLGWRRRGVLPAARAAAPRLFARARAPSLSLSPLALSNLPGGAVASFGRARARRGAADARGGRALARARGGAAALAAAAPAPARLAPGGSRGPRGAHSARQGARGVQRRGPRRGRGRSRRRGREPKQCTSGSGRHLRPA